MPDDDEAMEPLRGSFDDARNGDTARLAELLELGMPVNLTNERGDTLLILAAYHCHAEVVDLLLDHGADVQRANDNGQTALGAAVFRSSTDIVDRLLTAGADPDEGARSARAIAEFFDLPDIQAQLAAGAPHRPPR